MRRPVKVVYRYKDINNNLRYCLYCFVGDVRRTTMRALECCESGSYTTVKRRLNNKKHKTDKSALVAEFGPDWINYFFTDQHIAYDQKQHGAGDQANNTKDSDLNFEGWFEDGTIVNPAGNLNRADVQQDIERKLKIEKDDDPGIPFEVHSDDCRNIRMPLRRIWVTTCYILEDDTIHNVREKICYSIMVDQRFGKPYRLIPNRIALFRFDNMKCYPIGYSYERIEGNFWDVKLTNISEGVSRDKIKLDSVPTTKLERYCDEGNYATAVKHFVSNEYIQAQSKLDKILYQDDTRYNAQQIMMIDLYTELSIARNREYIEQNIDKFAKTYLTFFFPDCSNIELTEVINMLNQSTNQSADALQASAERKRRIKTWQALRTRIKALLCSTNMITRLSLQPKYDKYVRHEVVNQATMQCKLTLTGKFNNKKHRLSDTTLYHIFNTFVPTLKYIWIKLTTRNDTPTYKVYPNMPQDMLQQHASQYRNLFREHKKETYGLVAKMYIEQFDRYVHLTLGESLTLRIRTQWNETERMSFHIIETVIFPHVQDWIRKINSDMLLHQRNQRHLTTIEIPDISQARFVAINVNQYFDTPRPINFRMLSRIMNMLYPYVKVQESTSRNTLRMRYIRISEYNSKAQDRIETYVRQILKQRTDLNEADIIRLIQRVTKITEQQVIQLIRLVRTKYNISTNITHTGHKKTGKIRLNLVGVSMDFSKRDYVDKNTKRNRHIYRLRCMGIQNYACFERIRSFVGSIMYLLMNIGSKKLAWIQTNMKDVMNIVRIMRRHQINKYAATSSNNTVQSNIKRLVWLDQARFGYRPDNVNNSNYSRSCEKKKQPRGIIDNVAGRQELENLGYVIDEQGVARHKKSGIILPKLPNRKGEMRWYWCPTQQYRYPGFLPLDRHPDRLCQPCCYKNLQSESPTPHKQELYRHCMSTNVSTPIVNRQNVNYIHDRYHRIRKGRFGRLPFIMDKLFNERGVIPGKKHVCKFKTYGNKGNVLNHTGSDGFFVLLGMTIDNSFIRTCTQILQQRIMDPCNMQMNRFMTFLQHRFSSAPPELFTSIGDGRYRRRFPNVQRFIKYCFSPGNDIDKQIALADIISTPGVICREGINCFLFYGKKQHEDKDDIDIVINPRGSKMVQLEPFRTQSRTIILLCFNKSYYSVVRIFKKERKRKQETSQNIGVQRVFGPAMQPAMLDLYHRMYQNQYIKQLSATVVYNMLWHINVKPVGQVLDSFYYCYGLVLPDMTILPVIASGALPHLKTVPRTEHRSWQFDKLWDFLQRIPQYAQMLTQYIVMDETDGSHNNDTVTLSRLSTVDQSIQIPVVPHKVATVELERRGLHKISVMDNIVTALNSAIREGKYVGDECDNYLIQQEYVTELFNLVRFHVSYLLQNRKNRRTIQQVVNNRASLEQEVDQLFKKFIVIEQNIDWTTYRLVNQRVTCFDLKKKACTGINFRFYQGMCRLRVPQEVYSQFVKKIAQQISEPGIKRDELYQHHDAFIEDIIDMNQYDECKDCFLHQKNQYMKRGNALLRRIWMGVDTQDFDYNVVEGTEFSLSKLENDQNDNRRNPMTKHTEYLIQRVLSDDLAIFRAYANCFHWLNNPTEATLSRNLGFVDYHQERLAIWFRGNVLNYLKRWKPKKDTASDDLLNFDYRQYQAAVFDVDNETPLKPTLISLSLIRQYPIFFYNDNISKPLFIVKNGQIMSWNDSSKKQFDMTRVVHLRIIDRERVFAMYCQSN